MVQPPRFRAGDHVTLDATGAGQVALASPGAVEWVVTLQTVATSTAVKVPTAIVYRGFVAQANQVEGSYTGSNDASDTRIVLQPGEQIICVWTGGDVGATATYTIQGVQYPPGQAPPE